MTNFVKAYLFLDNGTYSLLLSDGSLRTLEKEEVRSFILSFTNSSHYSEIKKADLAEPSHVVAYVDSTCRLIVSNPILFADVFQTGVRYIPAAEYGLLHGKKGSIVYRHCREGRIPGAVLRDRRWWIPEGTPYPESDRRGRRPAQNSSE